MILSPKEILDKGILTSPDLELDLENQLQPNGIDIRVRDIQRVQCNMHTPLKLWADGRKTVPDPYTCEMTILDKEGNDEFVLNKGYAYSVECFEMVKVPRGMVALVYGRSTLHRNGVFCRASVYDSGFHDHIGLMMFPFQDAWIEVGTRIAQIVFYQAKTAHLYKGQYGLKG